MPSRLIREGILTSERVDMLSPLAELFYRRIMSVVDDYGRFSGNAKLIRSSAYPLRTDSVSINEINSWISECESAGLLQRYESGGKSFIALLDFRQQTRSRSKYPDPPARTCEALLSNCAAYSETETETETETVLPSVVHSSSSNAGARASEAPGPVLLPAAEPDEPDPSQLVADLVDELMPLHPQPGNRALAVAACEREFAGCVNPTGWIDATRVSHSRWREFWRDERARSRKVFIPQLHIWFRDGDYRAPPGRISSKREELIEEVFRERYGRADSKANR